MSEEKKSSDEKDSVLGKAFGAVHKEVKQIGKDVVDNTHEIKDEIIRYGKNRLVSGGALAFKGGLLGSVVPGIGTKVGIALGFTVGFLGGPPVARKLEKIFEKQRADVANDNPKPDKQPDNTPDNIGDNIKGPPPPSP